MPAIKSIPVATLAYAFDITNSDEITKLIENVGAVVDAKWIASLCMENFYIQDKNGRPWHFSYDSTEILEDKISSLHGKKDIAYRLVVLCMPQIKSYRDYSQILKDLESPSENLPYTDGEDWLLTWTLRLLLRDLSLVDIEKGRAYLESRGETLIQPVRAFQL